MKFTDKIYIAGHTGMVGSAILRKLINEGYKNIITASSKDLDLRNQMSVNEFFKTHQLNYEEFLKKEIDQVKPEKCGFCQICKWKNECDKIWIKEDNLNQVGGLSKVQLKKLNQINL